MNPQTSAAPHRRLVPALAAALLLLVVALFAAACGGDDEPSAAAGATAPEAAGVAAGETPEKITIGYQLIPNGDLVVKNLGWLEDALPGVAIEWKVFDSGGAVNEAFAAGALDIALAGSSPVSRGYSQGIDYRVPWIHDVIGSAEALAVKDGISDLDDLKGKRIAAPFTTTTHYSLLAALTDAGIDPSEVDLIDAEPPDIVAAWTRGDIDGAYVWNPSLASILDDGGTVLTDSAEQAAKGHRTYDLAVVSTAFADRYPAALATWVAQQDRAVKLYRDDPEAWGEAVGIELNIEPAEALRQAEGLIFLDASEQASADYLGGGIGDDLYATAEFNRDAGELVDVRTEQEYRDAVVVPDPAGS